jgi:hypothetical protein
VADATAGANSGCRHGVGTKGRSDFSGQCFPAAKHTVSQWQSWHNGTDAHRLERADLSHRLTIVREPWQLPDVLSVEEVTLLF